MNIKIIQPAGLGDILFCMKIAKVLLEEGHQIYWPIIPQYSWLPSRIICIGLHWENIENPDKIIDLQSAGRHFPNVPFMQAKYMSVNINCYDWQDWLNFNRDPNAENELYNLVVKSEPYCLICDTFASPPDEIKLNIPDSNIPSYRISHIEPYIPFDWCKIIENASELRFVDTCYTHISEKLKLKANILKLYKRSTENGIKTKGMWKNKWEYIE